MSSSPSPPSDLEVLRGLFGDSLSLPHPLQAWGETHLDAELADGVDSPDVWTEQIDETVESTTIERLTACDTRKRYSREEMLLIRQRLGDDVAVSDETKTALTPFVGTERIGEDDVSTTIGGLSAVDSRNRYSRDEMLLIRQTRSDEGAVSDDTKPALTRDVGTELGEDDTSTTIGCLSTADTRKRSPREEMPLIRPKRSDGGAVSDETKTAFISEEVSRNEVETRGDPVETQKAGQKTLEDDETGKGSAGVPKHGDEGTDVSRSTLRSSSGSTGSPTRKGLVSPLAEVSRIRYSREFILSLRKGHYECPTSIAGQIFHRYKAIESFSERRPSEGTNTCFAEDDTFAMVDACGISRSRDVVLQGSDENVTFRDLSLSAEVLAGLENAGFTRPSPVQVHGIPLGRLGVDLIAHAKSGTGKTLTFCVIALEMVRSIASKSGGLVAMILAPTRDIAAQIFGVLREVGDCISPKIQVGLFIGGTSVKADVGQLQNRIPSIAVGTPGRIEDLLCRGKMDASSVKLLVLDEADRLLGDSFGRSVPTICAILPQAKQIATFSATYSVSLLESLKDVMRAPQFVSLCQLDESCGSGNYETGSLQRREVESQSKSANADNQGAVLRFVRQFSLLTRAVGASPRLGDLVEILSRQPFGQAVVFSNDKEGGRLVTSGLRREGFAAVYTSGSEPQAVRNASMESMRDGTARVLVATDLVARGVDLPGCDLVVHLDVPTNTATYLHRVGRSGRFGSRGTSVLLFSSDVEKRAIQRLQEDLQIFFEDASFLAPVKEDQTAASDGGTRRKADESDCRNQAETESSNARCFAEDSGEIQNDISFRPVQDGEVERAEHEFDTERVEVGCDIAAMSSCVVGSSSTGADVSSPCMRMGSSAGTTAAREEAKRSEPPLGKDTAEESMWDNYAQEAYEAGHEAGYRMAQRIAHNILSRLGPDGLAAYLAQSGS